MNCIKLIIPPPFLYLFMTIYIYLSICPGYPGDQEDDGKEGPWGEGWTTGQVPVPQPQLLLCPQPRQGKDFYKDYYWRISWGQIKTRKLYVSICKPFTPRFVSTTLILKKVIVYFWPQRQSEMSVNISPFKSLCQGLGAGSLHAKDRLGGQCGHTQPQVDMLTGAG